MLNAICVQYSVKIVSFRCHYLQQITSILNDIRLKLFTLISINIVNKQGR